MKHMALDVLCLIKKMSACKQFIKKWCYFFGYCFHDARCIQVQKVWRGYYVRKYVFNYYSRKKYLEGLLVKNAMIR